MNADNEPTYYPTSSKSKPLCLSVSIRTKLVVHQVINNEEMIVRTVPTTMSSSKFLKLLTKDAVPVIL